MAHIDYFFATISSFTYLAGKRLEEIASKHGATITYKPVDLFDVFARTGATMPADRHISRQEYRIQELKRVSAKFGLPINLTPACWPVNPAPSAYSIIAAQSAGGGDLGELVHSFTRACWSEDRDLAQDDVIRDCLSKAGFDAGLADSDMLKSAEIYSANNDEAVKRGAFGAPFYITDTDQRFWGQDHLNDLDLHLAGKI